MSCTVHGGADSLSGPHGFWREMLLPIVIAACFFAVYMVNIGQQEFTNASENVVIQAAMETRQGGPVWIPNMLGRPRVTKPPLATWVTAAAMSDQTIAALRQGSVQSREEAYRQLAVQARWPSVLCSCLTLLGVYGLGRVMADRRVGLAAMVVCGSSMLFLRFGRMANTDVQITLWVTWANFCLALAVLRGRWWLGCAGAGVCLGLAIMSKGPVGLVQSVLPFMAFGLYRRFVPTEGLPADLGPRTGVKVAATFVGIILCLAIALPWPVSVLLSQSGMVAHWTKEITRAGATDHAPDAWWGYISVLPNMLPWVPLMIGGLCLPLLARFRRRPVILAWMLLVVPIVVMSFASDKNERYALPVVPAASVLAAYLAVEFAWNRERLTASDRLVAMIQWLVVAGMAAAIVAGAIPGITGQGGVWYSWPAAAGAAGFAMGVVAIALLMRRRAIWIGIPAAAVVSLVAYHMFMIGYCTVGPGQSSCRAVAMRAAAEYPDSDAVFYDPRPRPRHVPTDMPIYFGRVVRGVASVPSEAAPGPGQIMFVLQGAGEPALQIPQWTRLFAEPVDGRLCGVYGRLPADTAPKAVTGQ